MHFDNNMIMKKHFIISMLLVALVFGFASTSFAKQVTVQKGDTMWLIAKRYHVPFLEVLRLNKHYLNQHLIHPNDKIEIPDHNTGTNTGNNSSTDKIPEDNNTPVQSDVSQQAQAVLKLVNEERSKQGLKSLTLSSNLTQIANTKAKDMNDKGYFSHTSPTYGSPFAMLQHFGVKYRTAGENIAKGQATAEQVMRDWLNSSGHRANILGNYTQIGIGYYNKHWVQLFISK